MVRVLIWGTGEEYNKYINCVKLLEMKEQVTVTGVVSNDLYIKESLDGYRFIKKDRINSAEFDYCLIAVRNMMPVVAEATKHGIAADNCIPIRVTAIPGFDMGEYLRLKKSNISIFSANCWAGLCYHYLGLPFLSPTINMFESVADFNKMMLDLDYYMSLPVEYVKEDIVSTTGERFPVGKISDVELEFMHYTSFEEAETCWNKRKNRINKDNIFVLSYSDDKQELFDFEKIPFEHKMIFTSSRVKTPSAIYIDKSPWGELWQPVIDIATGTVNLLDIISLLNHKENYYRT